MKACTCFLLFRIFAYTISSPHNTPKEDKKGADLALKIVLELNAENVFKATDETFIDDHKIPQPDFRVPRVETFTDFIQGVANILNTYEDTAFADFFDILDKEIRKYHYRGCKFYELTKNYEFRSLMAEKLDLLKKKSVPVLKAEINEVADIIKHETYNKNVKELLDYINSLYKEDAREKFGKVLTDLKVYGNSKFEMNKSYLVKIIRNGVRANIFNHYTDLHINVRRELKKEIAIFLKKMNDTPSSKSKSNLIPSKTAVRKSKNTVEISENEKPESSLKIDPTSTADNKNILILKTSDKKHERKATKLKTSKEENNSQQLQITYLNTDETSDETIEGNSIELSQERQQELNSQTYATLYTEEISYKTTEKPEIIYKSDLKSKLVQSMLLEESTGRLPPGLPTTTPEISQETTSNEDEEADTVILIQNMSINSRDVSNEALRRSIPPPMPGEELSIEVFDREERKRQKFIAKSNKIITTVPHGIKYYIKRMRNLQKKVSQLKKIDEYNQNSKINITGNGYKVKYVIDEYEVKYKKHNTTVKNKKEHKNRKEHKKKREKIKKTKPISERQNHEYEARAQTEKSNIKVRQTKRDVEKTNSVNEVVQDLDSIKETVKNNDRHAHKLKKQKKVTRSMSTKATKTDKEYYKSSTDAVASAKI